MPNNACSSANGLVPLVPFLPKIEPKQIIFDCGKREWGGMEAVGGWAGLEYCDSLVVTT